MVEAGGLMAYGNDLVEIFHQAARVIDQILKGAKPADIFFYQPTKFELVINRTAAKEIGLVVSEPPSPARNCPSGCFAAAVAPGCHCARNEAIHAATRG